MSKLNNFNVVVLFLMLVMMVVVLSDPFRGMEERRNSAETQQSVHTSRSGPDRHHR